MSDRPTGILKPFWRWFGYAVVAIAALLSTVWIAEIMIAGMFMGWGGKQLAHAIFCLVLLAAEGAVIFFAIRASAASTRGDLAGTMIGILASLAPVPIAIGIITSGLFEP